jgi:hypothetical protein
MSSLTRYASGVWRRLRGLDRAWWDFYSIATDGAGIVVTSRYLWRDSTEQRVAWDSVRGVCVQDGGSGTDVYEIHCSTRPALLVAPAESPGAKEFLLELESRGFFPSPKETPRSDQVCDQCGHLYNPHRFCGYGEPPTEGWVECPVVGCECRGTWSVDPEASEKIRALFRPPDGE